MNWDFLEIMPEVDSTLLNRDSQQQPPTVISSGVEKSNSYALDPSATVGMTVLIRTHHQRAMARGVLPQSFRLGVAFLMILRRRPDRSESRTRR